MFAQPDPKKLAFLKAQADKLWAEAEKQRQIEQAYSEAKTGQERWREQHKHTQFCEQAGVCMCDSAFRVGTAA